MHRSTIIAAGIVSALIPLAAVAVSVEPQNGFVKGPRPSWTKSHAESGSTEHKEFHKTAHETMQSWSRTGVKGAALRQHLQTLERSHREFHRWTEAAKQQTKIREVSTTGIGGHPVMSPVGSSPLWSDDFRPIYAELRYEGTRPSGRLLREYARLRGVR